MNFSAYGVLIDLTGRGLMTDNASDLFLVGDV